MLRYVVKAPGTPAEIKEVEEGVDRLALFQDEVGGYIEAVTLHDLAAIEERGVSFFANEEGKFDPALPAHFLLRDNGWVYDVAFGPIVGVGYDPSTGHSISLSPALANDVAAGLNRLAAVDSPRTVYNIGNKALEALGVEPRERPAHLATPRTPGL